MKNNNFIMTILFMVLITTPGFYDLNAQKQVVPDAKLYEMMGQEEVDMTLQLAPEKILIYNHMINYSFYISNNVPSNTKIMGSVFDVKQIDGNQTLAVSEKDILENRFNYIEYDFRRSSKEYLAYKIGDSGSYLIVYPEDIYFEKEKAYVRSFGIKY
ncbi:MAG: hypothetical protein RBS19_02725 [Bacteroidales bacterium]|nr:hypothetical protein [Bacteroidales bacterium]MDY0215850.1 hypothetical protein [Bacteroidales bacterium]